MSKKDYLATISEWLRKSPNCITVMFITVNDESNITMDEIITVTSAVRNKTH